MAFTRTTLGKRSRTPRTRMGVQVNTFSLDKLIAGITGEMLADCLLDAAQPAYDEAKENWPILTGASNDSIELIKVGSSESLRRHHAGSNPGKVGRVALMVGGEKLINHPDNKSHKDYAPFIELNGSPLGRGRGTLQRAIYGNEGVIKDRLAVSLRARIAELVA